MDSPVRSRFLPFALVAALAACGERTDTGSPATLVDVADSAGVGIVVSRVPEGGFTDVARPASAPDLTLEGPGGEGPATWGDVVGVVTLEGGTVAVADGGGGTVHFFAPDGRWVGAQGEFLGLARMGRVAGDTVWVADPVQGRVGRVTPEGVAEVSGFPQGLLVAGRFADDAYLMTPVWSSVLMGDSVVEGVRRDESGWARWSPRGVSAEIVGTFPHDELMVLMGDDGPVAGVPPFGRRTSRVVAGDAFWVGDQETFEIHKHASDGTLLAILRLEGVDLTLTEALKASVRPEPSGEGPSLVDRFWDGVPGTRPAYTRFLTDASGRLWVAEHVAGEAPPRTWLVFTPEGGAEGLVTFPSGFVPFELGVDHAFGLEVGEEGARVVRYRLTR